MTFLKWVGGKRKVAKDIVSLVHEGKYVEGFVGGGSVMLELLGNGYQGQVVVNDLNEHLIRMWKDVRDNVEAVCRQLLSMGEKITEERYYELRREYNEIDDSIRKSALFITLNKTGYRGMYRVNQEGRFNVPFGNYKKPRVCGMQLRRVSRLIQRVQFECKDYREFLDEQATENAFVYLDPPYGGMFDGYTENGFDDDEFKVSVQRLFGKGCKVVCSNRADWECEGFRNRLLYDVCDRMNSKHPEKRRLEALFVG
jgi:DNA adenine methylase